jgi:hypothetical protein
MYGGMAVRFQLAMLKSGWIKSCRGFMIWSLTSLDPKMRGHSEKYWVESFYQIRTTSSFQARPQGQHRLRVIAGHIHLHHLQALHMTTAESISITAAGLGSAVSAGLGSAVSAAGC